MQVKSLQQHCTSTKDFVDKSECEEEEEDSQGNLEVSKLAFVKKVLPHRLARGRNVYRTGGDKAGELVTFDKNRRRKVDGKFIAAELSPTKTVKRGRPTKK